MPLSDLTAITPYGRDGASSRVRVFDWLDRFPGGHVTVLPYIGAVNAAAPTLLRHPARVVAAETALRRLIRRRPERLLLHREASPFTIGRLEARLLRTAALAVYDFDDALQWDTPRGLATRIFPKPAKCLAAVRNADRVIAGNDTLADWASAHARDVRVIPSCVEPDDYAQKASYVLSDPPRLVWMGSPSTEAYLAALVPPLRRLHAKYGLRLLIVSRGCRRIAGIEDITDRIPWSLPGFGGQVASADVAIAPLDDTPCSRGKCAYKLLQYGAVGLPMVGSPVGTNRQVLSELGGLSAVDDTDWFDAVDALLAMSDSDRAALGTHARKAVEACYSFAAWQSTWLAALDGGVP